MAANDPIEERPTLVEVLEAFRDAAQTSAKAVALDLREPPARTGNEPVYGIEGLEISLNVGVHCTPDEVRLDFDEDAASRSTIAFRVQVPPVQSVQRPTINVTPVYDQRGIPGRFTYQAVLTDSSGYPVPDTPVDLRARRGDREGGQVRTTTLTTDAHGAVQFEVDTADQTLQAPGSAVVELPVKTAASWQLWLECANPPASSAYIVVPRRKKKS